MAYFYRLAASVLLAFMLSMLWTPAQASFPATPDPTVCTVGPCYTYANVKGGGMSITVQAACSTGSGKPASDPSFTYGALTGSGVASTAKCSGPVNFTSNGAFYANTNFSIGYVSVSPSPPAYLCPSGASLSGSSCSCPAPGVENATHDGCVANCDAATVATTTIGLGWYKAGEGGIGLAGGTVQPFRDAKEKAKTMCVPGNPGRPNCAASVDPTAILLKGLTNGSFAVSASVTGHLTGAECTGDLTPAVVTAPPPPCDGQSGTVNGVAVCLPTESQASKDQRAADAASAAARQASADAIAAGKTADEAAKAAAAAGAAAAAASRGGASKEGAAAAGAAAGSASAATSTAAGAGAAAGQAAKEAAKAAGASDTVADSAAAAASAAAATAAAQALSQGKSPAVIEAAGRVAGQAAAGSVYNGMGGGAAATAGANAGAGAAAEKAAKDEGSDLDKFCAAHPAAALCKDAVDSKFSMGCDTPPVCTGDAIQCAVAASVFKTNCALNPASGPESAAYDAVKGLTGNRITDLPGNRTVNISSSSFDSTEFLGGAQGAQDLTVTVAGRSIVLSLSKVNPWLSRLGLLLQAVTFLVCLKIVFREGES